MFGLLSVVSMILTTKEIIKEKTEPVAPKGTRFDWDAYWEDIRNGMTIMEQIKKRERGGYLATKPTPPQWHDLPLDAVVDTERYKHDKELYGENIVENWRKCGRYRYKKKF
jgi:hypothetical protein